MICSMWDGSRWPLVRRTGFMLASMRYPFWNSIRQVFIFARIRTRHGWPFSAHAAQEYETHLVSPLQREAYGKQAECAS
jgi:hypothetical protein